MHSERRGQRKCVCLGPAFPTTGNGRGMDGVQPDAATGKGRGMVGVQPVVAGRGKDGVQPVAPPELSVRVMGDAARVEFKKAAFPAQVERRRTFCGRGRGWQPMFRTAERAAAAVKVERMSAADIVPIPFCVTESVEFQVG